MKIAFRVDAGTEIGRGHLSRCLAIATEAKKQGVTQCYFLMREHNGHFSSEVEKFGFGVINIPLAFIPDYGNANYCDWVGGCSNEDADFFLSALKCLGFSKDDWVVIDHYGLNDSYERRFVNEGYKVCVIDDLVNRKHQCNLLIDQTCGRLADEYSTLINADTIILAGERFCMLRPEFPEYREFALNRRKGFKLIEQVFVNFGSTDPSNITTKVISDIDSYCFSNGISIKLAVGSACPHIRAINKQIQNAQADIELLVDANNVAKLMSEADIAIGAAGSATWERCVLGLPTILVKTAENQSDVVNKVVSYNAAIYHDLNAVHQAELFERAIESVVHNYSEISQNASSLVDGQGLQRVINHILSWEG